MKFSLKVVSPVLPKKKVFRPWAAVRTWALSRANNLRFFLTFFVDTFVQIMNWSGSMRRPWFSIGRISLAIHWLRHQHWRWRSRNFCLWVWSCHLKWSKNLSNNVFQNHAIEKNEILRQIVCNRPNVFFFRELQKQRYSLMEIWLKKLVTMCLRNYVKSTYLLLNNTTSWILEIIFSWE